MTRIALSPVTAVTMDPRAPVVQDAAIHVDDGIITYVGPSDIAPGFDADEVRGGTELVALPGLVNTHCHQAMTLMRGYADDMALEPWLEERIWPFEGRLDGEDVYWGTQLAVAEMIRNGVTCAADMYFFHRRGTEAMVESGFRALTSAGVIGVFPDVPGQIAEARAFAQEVSEEGHGRIRPSIAAHSLYTLEREHWIRVVDAAGDLGVPIQTHAAETRTEVEEVQRTWGASPIQALDSLGALDVELIAAHCVHLDEADLELMARRRDDRSAVRVAHNPTSNCKLASGVAPVAEFLARGIDVGLATDGTASNNRLDIWSEMRLTALLHKAVSLDPTALPAADVLKMGTLGGARVLGFEDEIGSLEVGKRADIVLVDFHQPHLRPPHDVVSHLVYAAAAADVVTVMVDGRLLYDAGRHLTIDVERAMAEVDARARSLAAHRGGK